MKKTTIFSSMGTFILIVVACMLFDYSKEGSFNIGSNLMMALIAIVISAGVGLFVEWNGKRLKEEEN